MTDATVSPPKSVRLSSGQITALVIAGVAALLVLLGMSGALDKSGLAYKALIDPFVQMWELPDLFVQTLWEGLVGGVLYALIALGFVLISRPPAFSILRRASWWCLQRCRSSAPMQNYLPPFFGPCRGVHRADCRDRHHVCAGAGG